MTNDKKNQYKLERHLWPDQVAEKKRTKYRNFFLIGFLVFTFVLGTGFGYVLTRGFNPVANNGVKDDKLEALYQIMGNDWYYGKDHPDLENELIQGAYNGLVNSGADIHTQYMSPEQMKNFTESIDLGFVGIGVEYMNQQGNYLITKVFKDSPADKAGVHAGDIIYRINGTLAENVESEDLVAKVKGEEGTTVSIEFKRGNEILKKDIVRGTVENTAYGEMFDATTGYLQINQFGSSTAEEVKKYMDFLIESGSTDLIIDLRNNGGGYLDALVDIASLFLPQNSVVFQQKDKNGNIVNNGTNPKIDSYDPFNKIVILINENTASASEVLAISLKEQLTSVTLMGDTTYGKGTVQVSRPFSDGSAIKYTTAEWLSSKGTSINGIGVKPDVEVSLHDVLKMEYLTLEEGQIFKYDQVDVSVLTMQKALDFLGYKPTRTDGYFDQTTVDILSQFQSDSKMTVTGTLDMDTLQRLLSEVVKHFSAQPKEYDSQLLQAGEMIHGR